ncbi:MAG: glutamine-hydrolyzing carbamoyl-phosphate synthase small subunit [Candidatus Hydrogenedentes bacterium]|nr:glutamine-hydrolyzing carbamoyl-phosphate synthase small subunit [Candidatus Hydrogenedentota bacterium]
MKALLALENGMVFEGRSVGADGESGGELVFNTSMSGYQEILTDPSYAGQIVTMTYPHIGNYGVNLDDVESRKPFVYGFVMRECCFDPSNWRATMSLPQYLKENNIVAIDGVDTRKITLILRDQGNQRAIISTTDLDAESVVAKARALPEMSGSDFVKAVSQTEAYDWEDPEEARYTVVAFDFGIKHNILRMLRDHGCDVVVVPATATAEEILAHNPDGIFLSNGPGDPSALPYIYPTIQALIEKQTPLFGICLGHQIVAHALGGKTYKLKFGHRGANQPVLNHDTGRVEITSQNHGFAVDPESLDASKVRITHTHLNDNTCSGLEHLELPVFSVQYHPEASPGPHDSRYLFERFVKMMEERRAMKASA